MSQKSYVDQFSKNSLLIDKYIEQREKGASEALKEPLVMSEPLAAATSQTLNVTQLKDYMAKIIYKHTVVRLIFEKPNVVCHCLQNDGANVLFVFKIDQAQNVKNWQERSFSVEDTLSAITTSPTHIYAMTRTGKLFELDITNVSKKVEPKAQAKLEPNEHCTEMLIYRHAKKSLLLCNLTA